MAGREIWQNYSPLSPGTGDIRCTRFPGQACNRQEVGLIFLATPHEVSRSLVPQAIAHGLRVVDLSGAWRLKQEQHRAIYGFQDSDRRVAAELTDKSVYGLPELNADRIASAALVANPGCYATSVILALAPLAQGRSRRPKARHYRGFEIRSLRRGQRADGKNAFCLGGRQFFGLFESSIIGTWAKFSSNCSLKGRNWFSRRTCCRFHAEFCLRFTFSSIVR